MTNFPCQRVAEAFDRSLHNLILHWRWALLLQFVFFGKSKAPEGTLLRFKFFPNMSRREAKFGYSILNHDLCVATEQNY